MFTPKNIESVAIIFTLEGFDEIETETITTTTKQHEQYFFHQRLKEIARIF